ncbi:MAG: glycosyltransferase [Actinophytocola sp.]|uniref:glycosyltransferase n=1 Tax=Actinophytocola sp. TaxID=1872138 RepID=UPI003D6B6925
MAVQLIRVASVPSGHTYVRHLSDPDGSDRVTRLADPTPCSAPSTAERWWPPAMLDPRWLTDHHTEFDVFHLHFGFDAATPAELTEIAATLRGLGKPFVYTVHDLRNPHHRDTATHLAQLDVLVPAADALVTLTPGAAEVITARWGQRAEVIPHPHVVERADIPPSRAHPFTVGVHAKSLRPNMAPLPVVDVLCDVVADLPDARLRVDIHHEVVDPAGNRHDPDVIAALRAWHDAGRLSLHIHDFFTDAELWRYLADLDLSVLPYTFGTHSGWLEACYDLGTTVATSTCGFYAQQRPCLTYRHDEHGLDAEGLADAVRLCHDKRPEWRADPAERERERRRIARRYRLLYEAVLS